MLAGSEEIRAIHGLRGLARIVGGASEGAMTMDTTNVTACAVPAAPEDPDANFVAYTDSLALIVVLDDVAEMYNEADVMLWSVYVPEHDEKVREFLTEHGYKEADRLPVLSCDLAGFNAPPVRSLEYVVTQDVATLGRINAAAYDRPAMAAALAHTPDVAGLRVYEGQYNGETVAVVMTVDMPSPGGRTDLAAYFLAADPGAPKIGSGPRLMHAALVEARERGCVRAIGEASPDGMRIYKRWAVPVVSHFVRYQPQGR
jgi:GNAT superfamily N-acetyltransferase